MRSATPTSRTKLTKRSRRRRGNNSHKPLQEVAAVSNKDFRSLTLDAMQSYVNTRRKEDNHLGGKVSGKTIKKELLTFMQIWNWARPRGCVDGPCPFKDPHNPRKWAVKLPKMEDSGRFMTWDEIERRIARGGLSEEQAAKTVEIPIPRRNSGH